MNRLEIENDWLDSAGARSLALAGAEPLCLGSDPTAELASLLQEAERLDLDYLTILALDAAGFTF